MKLTPVSRMNTPPTARDKLSFTPGPLTTSLSVKQAMLHDAGSWHFEFNALVARIRERLLNSPAVSRENGWEVILLQGSGTFGVEAVFQTCVPPDGKVAVLANGAYGERMVQMLQCARITPCGRTAGRHCAEPAALEAGLARRPDRHPRRGGALRNDDGHSQSHRAIGRVASATEGASSWTP